MHKNGVNIFNLDIILCLWLKRCWVFKFGCLRVEWFFWGFMAIFFFLKEIISLGSVFSVYFLLSFFWSFQNVLLMTGCSFFFFLFTLNVTVVCWISATMA